MMKTIKPIKNLTGGFAIPFLKVLGIGIHEMRRYKTFLLFLALLHVMPAFASNQGNTVTGIVTDVVDGSPIPGATVMIKGTNVGTITDMNGRYSLSATSNDIIVFSFVGYAKNELQVGDQSVINVQLALDITQMDEVVIVGYGVQKRESVVGSITQVDGTDLMKAGGVTNVGEALQGRLPGVTTITGNNQPGETDIKIFIRGQSTWNNEGQPLIIVDGVERNLGDIDMNEIDKISVLKDASATAVFGVKGGNGVIMITTKRGNIGKPQLTLSANTTVKTYSKIPKKT